MSLPHLSKSAGLLFVSLICDRYCREVIAERDKTIAEKEKLMLDLKRQTDSITDKLKVHIKNTCYHTVILLAL